MSENTTKPTFDEVCNFVLTQATSDQLEMLLSLHKIRRGVKAVEADASFKIGDKVSFDVKTRGIKTGIITKINNKSIKVNCDGAMWNVSPTFLKKVE